MGGNDSKPKSEEQATTQLAPIEVEALARASAIGTVETEPIDDERATIEMVSLVAIVDDEPEPKLARGSDAIPPRTDRITQLRRRRESLRVEQIVKKKPTDE